MQRSETHHRGTRHPLYGGPRTVVAVPGPGMLVLFLFHPRFDGRDKTRPSMSVSAQDGDPGHPVTFLNI
ncbi:MAG: hypothetical protein P8Y38_09550 [Deltaproteobacteria bacterium]